MVNELLQIPGVGPSIAADFVCQGLTTIASLRGQDPEHMYARQCELQGGHVDRCFLYVCRCAVYFAEHTRHDPAKLKWWHWKDAAPEAPAPFAARTGKRADRK